MDSLPPKRTKTSTCQYLAEFFEKVEYLDKGLYIFEVHMFPDPAAAGGEYRLLEHIVIE